VCECKCVCASVSVSVCMCVSRSGLGYGCSMYVMAQAVVDQWLGWWLLRHLESCWRHLRVCVSVSACVCECEFERVYVCEQIRSGLWLQHVRDGSSCRRPMGRMVAPETLKRLLEASACV